MITPIIVFRPRVRRVSVAVSPCRSVYVSKRGSRGLPGSDADLTAHLAAADPHSQYATDSDLSTGLAGKADLSHTHAQANVTNLVSDLAGKAAASHTHPPANITGGTASTLACFNASGVLVSYNGVVVDQVNGRVGIGVTPAVRLDVRQDWNGQAVIQVVNANTGSAAQANLTTGNGTFNMNCGITSGAFAPYGIIGGHCGFFYASGNGGLAIVADSLSGALRVATGGSAQRFAVEANGRVVVGTGSASAILHAKTTAALTGFIVQGAASQSAPLFASWDSAGAELNRITPAGNFLVGTNSSTNPIHALRNQNGNTIIQVENAHAGTAAQAIFVTSNGTDTGTYGTTGTGWNPFGSLLARMVYLYTTRVLCLMSEGLKWLNSSGAQLLELTTTGKLNFNATMTPAGTVGARTINMATGSINIAAGGTSVVLTNSLATTSCIPFAQLMTVDATAKSVAVTRAGGTVTFTLNAAATGEVAIGFLVINA